MSMTMARIVLLRSRRMPKLLESGLVSSVGINFCNQFPSVSNFMVTKRGLKTTDSVHPVPVYNEDEKILKKVLDERLEQCDDLPVGMGNPYEKPKRKCILCEHGIIPNYKNIKLLYQFVSPYTGMLYERHITGLCKTQHEKVEAEVRLSTSLGLMTNYYKEVEFLKDPKLCDPERPARPHKY